MIASDDRYQFRSIETMNIMLILIIDFSILSSIMLL